MSLLFRRASLASLGLALRPVGSVAVAVMAQDTARRARPQPRRAPAAAPVDPNAVVATVGGEPITEADLALAAEDLGAAARAAAAGPAPRRGPLGG